MNPTPRQVVIGGAVLVLTTIGSVAGAVAQAVGASPIVLLFALLAALIGAGFSWRSLTRLRPAGGRNSWWLVAAGLGGFVLVAAPTAVQTVIVTGLAGFLIVASPLVCRRVLADRRRASSRPAGV